MEMFFKLLGELVSAICEILPLAGDGQERLAGELYINLTEAGMGAWPGVFARLGVLAAIIFFLRERLLNLGKAFCEIIKDIFGKRFTLKYSEGDKKYVLFVIGGWLPLIPGAIFSGMFDKVSSGNMALAIAFLLSGLFLFASDRIKKGERDGESSLVTDGPVIGVFRLLGMIPGISGMGGTMFGSLLSGYNGKTAVEYSLLLALPAILFGTLIRICNAAFSVSLFEAVGSLILLAAGATGGFYAIKLLYKAVNEKKLKLFSLILFAEAIFTFIIFLRG